MDPKYPDEQDNAPPLLEDGHDSVFGDAFAFNADILKVVQELSQRALGSVVGNLQTLNLGDQSKSFVNLTGLILASCRIQTGVGSNMIGKEGVLGGAPTSLSAYTAFIPFQEGKFTEPPYVITQAFIDYGDAPASDLVAWVVDRVTTAGCRITSGSTDRQDSEAKFFWMAIQPPWGWALLSSHFDTTSPVEDDPANILWEDLP